MFALDVVIQTVVDGAAENPGKMNVTPVVLVITNQIRTISNGEGHQTVSETVDSVPAEEVVLAGKSTKLLSCITIHVSKVESRFECDKPLLFVTHETFRLLSK